ncbi:hypothetical protein M0R72_09225 [Candidatus Pacearchaeota archaeon]|jgi:hypothetical protein|nr:hypothetical protein [Candidatus Pacearchaeota archaeon]
MGIDLTVCPIRDDRPGYDRLQIDRDSELFDLVKQLPTLSIPDPVDFNWYEQDGIEKRATDEYGFPLTYCNAGQFRKIDASKQEGWNHAVLMFLQALPPSTPVVLWWH